MKYMLSSNNNVYTTKQGAQRAGLKEFPNADVVHFGGKKANLMVGDKIVATVTAVANNSPRSHLRRLPTGKLIEVNFFKTTLPTLAQLEEALEIRRKIDALQTRLGGMFA